MGAYDSGRRSANNVQILGWMFVALGLLIAVASIVLSLIGADSFAGLPILLPSAALTLLGSIAILLAHVARAIFDMAQRGGA